MLEWFEWFIEVKAFVVNSQLHEAVKHCATYHLLILLTNMIIMSIENGLELVLAKNITYVMWVVLERKLAKLNSIIFE